MASIRSIKPRRPASLLQGKAAAVRLRRAEMTDLDAIVALEQASFRYQAEMFNRRQLRSLIGNSLSVAMVAQRGRRVVGWVVGLVRRHAGSPQRSGRVYGLAVHREAQGQGIGRRLMERVLRALERRGVRRIYLEVRVDNHPAIELYKRLGFEVLCRLPDYYGRGRHGQRMLRRERSQEMAAKPSDVVRNRHPARILVRTAAHRPV